MRETEWAMSEENVEIVRRGYEAFERGDLSEAFRDAADDLVSFRAHPDAKDFHGPDGLLDSFADWTEGFDEFKLTAEEFIDAGDCVIVRVHHVARGQGSGVPVEGDYWFVYTLRDGKWTRLDMLGSKAQALKAAGQLE